MFIQIKNINSISDDTKEEILYGLISRSTITWLHRQLKFLKIKGRSRLISSFNSVYSYNIKHKLSERWSFSEQQRNERKACIKNLLSQRSFDELLNVFFQHFCINTIMRNIHNITGIKDFNINIKLELDEITQTKQEPLTSNEEEFNIN